jgi:hypothetical protein
LWELAAFAFKVWVVTEENGVLKHCKRRLVLHKNVATTVKPQLYVSAYCSLHDFIHFCTVGAKCP